LDIVELTKTGHTRSIGYTVDHCKILEERSEADQITWECKVTDYLQEQVEHFNPTLKNFQLRLEMEDVGNTKSNNAKSNDILSFLVKREELST
jgi:hypothetical protein